MFVHFRCPAGHRIKADRCFEGLTTGCPACGTATEIPRQVPDALTETGALRLLNDCESASADIAPAHEVKVKTTKDCPRCHTALPLSANLCPHCRLHVGESMDTWNSMFRRALREVSSRRAS